MVFWSSTTGMRSMDGVTLDDDYTCPKCRYRGHLLLCLLKTRTKVFSIIPVSGWREQGAWMVCPACDHGSRLLSRRKYRKLAKIDEGPEFVAALATVRSAVNRQFPGSE